MDRDGIVVGASAATAADAAAAGAEAEGGGGGGETTVANAIHGTATAISDMPIIIPNDKIKPTDILLGRGSQHAQWEGNVRFRKIAKERRREYNSRRCKNRTKSTIAQEILDAVLSGRGSSLVTTSTASSDAATGTAAKLETAPPGRFLEQVDADVAEKAGVSTDQCNWQVAGTKRTLDKIKMTLRQKKKKKDGEPRGADRRKRSNSSSSSSSSSASSSSRSGHDNDRKCLESSHTLQAQPSSAATIPGTAITAAGAGAPRQVAFVGGAPTSGIGNATGANNQQLLSVLASSLLGGGGAPGSVASNNNMLRQLQQPQLPALNAVNAADVDVLLRTLLAQRLQEQQHQQQQLQAAALAELVQSAGGGGGVPPPTNQGTGAPPSPTRAAPPAIDPGIVLTLLEQLRQGQQQQAATVGTAMQQVGVVQSGAPAIHAASLTNIDPGSILAMLRGQQPRPQQQQQQQQHGRFVPTALVAPHPQPGFAFTAVSSPPTSTSAPATTPPSMAPLNNNELGPILTSLQQMQQQSHPPVQQECQQPAPRPTAPTPSVQVMQAMLYQLRQAASVLGSAAPHASTGNVEASTGGPDVTASLSILVGTTTSTGGGTHPDPGRSGQGPANNSHAMGHVLGLLAKALLDKNQGPEQSQ